MTTPAGTTIITSPHRAHEGAPVAVAWVGRPGGVYLDEIDPDDHWRRTRRTLLYTGAYSLQRAAQIRGHARLARRLQPLVGVNSRELGPADVPSMRRHYRWGMAYGPGEALGGMVAEMDHADAAALFRSAFAREFLYLDIDQQAHATRVATNTGQELRQHQHGRAGNPAGEPGSSGLVLAGLLRTTVGPSDHPGVRPLMEQERAQRFPRRR